MSLHSHSPPSVTPANDHPAQSPLNAADASSSTSSSSSSSPSSHPPDSDSPHAFPTSKSLDTLRRKASELAAIDSTDRRDERRQTAMELAAAMPECLNCHNRAKLTCSNQRCHACCTSTNIPCLAHRTSDGTAHRHKRNSPTASASPAADRQVMLDELAADEVIGVVVTGVVEEEIECGYRVRLLVNGYVCEGLLFGDAYAVTVNTLPADLTVKELQSVTIDALPTLPLSDRPLFPSLPSTTTAAVASHPKVKVKRHPPGYPTGPRSAYVYYTATQRARAQTAESEEERQAMKADWSVLSDNDRAPYKRLAQLDKERWMREMAEWKSSTEEDGGREVNGSSNVDATADH